MPVYEEKSKINGQKKWFIRTYITDELGNRKQITKHNKNWIGREGKKEAERVETTLFNQTKYAGANTPFGIFLDTFIKTKQNEIEISSVRNYKQIIRLYIENFFPKSKPLNKFTNSDAIAFKNKLSEYNFSLKYKKSIYVVMESIFSLANKLYEVKNVFESVGNFVITKKDINPKEMNILTENEFKLFIKQEPFEIFRDFFTILFYTGMRKGEALALNWGSIDFNERTIYIDESFSTNDNMLLNPKTKKSRRKIIMSDNIYNILKKIEKRSNEEYLFKDYVRATTLREHCQRNLDKAGIKKHIRIHDFRHSFASLCINKGVPIAIVSNYMGHESISTTMNVYGHLYPNAQNAIIDALESQNNLAKKIFEYDPRELLLNELANADNVEKIKELLSKKNALELINT